MAVLLSPVGGAAAQFLDNNGNPLSGGKLYTYVAGTTTPQATYTTASGATAHTNPIVLDSGGRVPSGEIWLTDGLQYKFVLKTSTDVLIGTYDNLIGINSNFVNFVTDSEIQTATAGQTVFTLTTMQYQPGTNNLSVFVDGVNQYDGASYSYVETSSTVVTFTAGLHVGALVKFTTAQTLSTGVTDASLVAFTGFKSQSGVVQDLAGDDGSDWIGFKPAGTSAIAESVQDKLRQVISIVDFGAKQDGTSATATTAAIQAALDYATTVKRAVYAPAGVYLMNATVVVPSDVMLYGDGVGTEFKRDTTATPFDFFEIKNTARIQFHNFYVNGVSKLDNGTVANRYCGIRIWADGGAQPNDIEIVGVQIDKTTSGEIQSEGNRAAVLLEDCYDVRMSRCKFYDNRATAILITVEYGQTAINTERIQIEQCYGVGEVAPFDPSFPDGFGSFISGNSHQDVLVSGCYVDGFGFSNISLNGPRSTVQNCISKNSNYSGINLGHTTTGENCDDSAVVGNITTGNTFSGVVIAGSKRIVVANNVIYDDGATTGWPGVRVLHDSNYDSGETQDIKISNNLIMVCTYGGVIVECGTQIHITGNTIADCGSAGIFLREKESTETMWAFVSNNILRDNGTTNAAVEVNTSAASGFGPVNAVVKDNYVYSSDIATKQRRGMVTTGDSTAVMQVNNNWFSSNYNGVGVNTSGGTYGYALNQFSTSSLTNANIVNA